MPVYDDQLLKDFDTHLDNLRKCHEWLSKVYYLPGVSALLNQTRINLLITGCTFLVDNLVELRLLYQTKVKE